MPDSIISNSFPNSADDSCQTRMVKNILMRRGNRGSGLIEAVAVGLVLVVIAMALIDLIVMVLANGVNDAAAKNAARAAASQSTFPKAYAAAKNAVQAQETSGFISSLILQGIDYDPNKTVSCKTKLEVNLPIPVPGVGASFVFMAQSTEPIVAH